MLHMWELSESDLFTLPVTDCSSLLKTETPQIAIDVCFLIVCSSCDYQLLLLLLSSNLLISSIWMTAIHFDFVLVNAHLKKWVVLLLQLPASVLDLYYGIALSPRMLSMAVVRNLPPVDAIVLVH